MRIRISITLKNKRKHRIINIKTQSPENNEYANMEKLLNNDKINISKHESAEYF